MVSIDFWNTLVHSAAGSALRKKARVDALQAVAKQHGMVLSATEIDEAKNVASQKFDHIWLNFHRTLNSNHLVTYIAEYLEIPVRPNEHHFLVTIFEESFWEGPPELAEDAQRIIPLLAQKYPLCLISDTMYTPGRILHSYLESKNLDQYFKCFVFSDETGFSKPNPNAFYKALQETQSTAAESYHIGDLLETDIQGAKNVGMHAVLFTHFSDHKVDNPEFEPDSICRHWSEVGDLLL